MPTAFSADLAFSRLGGSGMWIFGSALNPSTLPNWATTRSEPTRSASFRPAAMSVLERAEVVVVEVWPPPRRSWAFLSQSKAGAGRGRDRIKSVAAAQEVRQYFDWRVMGESPGEGWWGLCPFAV